MTIVLTQPSYQELEEALEQGDWQTADRITFELMLDAANRGEEEWLNQDAIARFPCEVLHQLDQRWLRYSGNHFGFSAQLQIYIAEANRAAFAFSRKVDWTWSLATSRPLGFFKFYDRLTFSLEEAPQGHLPALWFWEMPWYVSYRMGGFGTGRGAAFGDASLFDSLMLRLERCQRI
ncbi:MAG: GUN4 domain-containing protein [Leptolyngbyaceae cyanobacterium]